MKATDLRVRQYRLLRSRGYTANAALWNVRHCSNLFWQRMLFGCMDKPRCVAHTTRRN